MGHKIFSALGLALALVLPLSVQAAPADGSSSANAWLGLMDHAAYSDCWTSSSTALKSRISANQWLEVIRPLRDAFGPVVSRTLASEQSSKSLPGVPDGNYKVLSFSTQFAAKKDATETVILSEEAGDWKVAGYFIR